MQTLEGVNIKICGKQINKI